MRINMNITHGKPSAEDHAQIFITLEDLEDYYISPNELIIDGYKVNITEDMKVELLYTDLNVIIKLDCSINNKFVDNTLKMIRQFHFFGLYERQWTMPKEDN